MDNIKNNIWNDIIEELSEELKRDDLYLWFSSVKKADIKDNILEIEVPNNLYIERISKKEETIKTRIKILTGVDVVIKYTISPISDTEQITEIPKKEETVQNAFITKLNPEYTFDDMVISQFNQLAASFSRSVASEIGKINPFFIYSRPGLGKTHMLHSIGNEILKNKPFLKVLYITAEDFVNEYITSIQQSRVDLFRNKYRNLDCLLIDDIQFIVTKERSEEEFFFTFNTLFEYKKQIVVTSDRPPNDIALNERLISRFKIGPVADIRPPELEERMAILRKENEKQRYNIPDDVISFIAQNIKDSIRSLKGSLLNVYHFSVYSNEYPTIDKTKEWIKDHLSVNDLNSKPAIKVDDIQRIIADEYGISVDDIKSKQRSERFAFPRQVAIYITCELTDMSLPDIGKFFNKDHSTIIHARDKIKQYLNNDPFFSEKVNNIINKINNKNVD